MYTTPCREEARSVSGLINDMHFARKCTCQITIDSA